MIDADARARLETIVRDRAERDGGYATAFAVAILAHRIEEALAEVNANLAFIVDAINAMTNDEGEVEVRLKGVDP